MGGSHTSDDANCLPPARSNHHLSSLSLSLSLSLALALALAQPQCGRLGRLLYMHLTGLLVSIYAACDCDWSFGKHFCVSPLRTPLPSARTPVCGQPPTKTGPHCGPGLRIAFAGSGRGPRFLTPLVTWI